MVGKARGHAAWLMTEVSILVPIDRSVDTFCIAAASYDLKCISWLRISKIVRMIQGYFPHFSTASSVMRVC